LLFAITCVYFGIIVARWVAAKCSRRGDCKKPEFSIQYTV